MKTIKQIADEIGVSKQAVQKRISREPLNSSIDKYIDKVGGTIYISSIGEELIKSAFLKSNRVQGVDNQKNDVYIQESEILDILKSTIDTLQTQLDTKDTQIYAKDMLIQQQQQNINELTSALDNTTESLKAAQALHAGTMQKQLQASENEKEEIEVIEEKQGFWQRVFRKK